MTDKAYHGSQAHDLLESTTKSGVVYGRIFKTMTNGGSRVVRAYSKYSATWADRVCY